MLHPGLARDASGVTGSACPSPAGASADETVFKVYLPLSQAEPGIFSVVYNVVILKPSLPFPLLYIAKHAAAFCWQCLFDPAIPCLELASN